MPVETLKRFLDSNNVKYDSIVHSRAVTAQETAQSAHVKGKELAKTVMIKADGKMAMAVLPASYKVEFDLLKEGIGARSVELAGENEFKELFPNCEIGAMPPFGNLYDMEVFVAESLTKDEEIAFNAGSHIELIRLPYADFERLVRPKVLDFATKV